MHEVTKYSEPHVMWLSTELISFIAVYFWRAQSVFCNFCKFH